MTRMTTMSKVHENSDIVLHETKSMIEIVSQSEEHRSLSNQSRRQVMNALVQLDTTPSEDEVDKLLTMVGPRYDTRLDLVIPKRYMRVVMDSYQPEDGGWDVEDQRMYRIHDLIRILGVNSVFAAVDYSYDVIELRDEKDNTVDDALVILAGARLAKEHDLKSAEEIDQQVGFYAEKNEISHGQAIVSLASMTIQQMEEKSQQESQF